MKDEIEPMVSIIITAYNEEKDIANKIKNTLSLDYPKEKLEIIVASDGSTDKTEEIIRNQFSNDVRLLRVEGRVGKTQTQNRAVDIAVGDILVFSDAASMYEKRAIKKLVRNFADEEVGGVAGKCSYVEPDAPGRTSIPTKIYWGLETIIKQCQTRLGSITGASGLIYAVRRKNYTPLPSSIISDMTEPIEVVKQNKRFVYEPEAVAFEKTTSEFRQEFKMRVRVITRGMTGMLYVRSLLNPFKYGAISFQLFSHKILRWMLPFYLIGLFALNYFLRNDPFFHYLFIVQLLFYFFALTSMALSFFGKKVLFLDILLYICVVASASLVAFFMVALGRHHVSWEPERQ